MRPGRRTSASPSPKNAVSVRRVLLQLRQTQKQGLLLKKRLVATKVLAVKYKRLALKLKKVSDATRVQQQLKLKQLTAQLKAADPDKVARLEQALQRAETEGQSLVDRAEKREEDVTQLEQRAHQLEAALGEQEGLRQDLEEQLRQGYGELTRERARAASEVGAAQSRLELLEKKANLQKARIEDLEGRLREAESQRTDRAEGQERVALLQAELSQNQALLDQMRERCLGLEQEVSEAAGRLEQAEQQERELGLARGEVERLELELEARGQELDGARAHSSRVCAELDEARQALSLEDGALEEQRVQLERAQKRGDELAQRMQDQADELAQAHSLVQDLETLLRAREQDLGSEELHRERAVSELTSRFGLMEKKAGLQTARIEGLEVKLREAEARLAEREQEASEAARRFEEADELRLSEIGRLELELSARGAEIEEARAEFSRVRAEVEEAEAHLTERDSALGDSSRALAEFRTQLEQAQQRGDELERLTHERASELAEANSLIHELEAMVSTAETEHGQAQDRLDELEEQLENATQDVAQKNGRMAELEDLLRQATESLGRKEERIAELWSELATANEILLGLERQAASGMESKRELVLVTQQLKEARSALVAARGQLEQKQVRIETLQEELQVSITRAVGSKELAQSDLVEMRKRILELHNRAESVENAKFRAEAQIAQLKRDIENRDSQLARLDALVGILEEKHEELERQVEEAREQLSLSMEGREQTAEQLTRKNQLLEELGAQLLEREKEFRDLQGRYQSLKESARGQEEAANTTKTRLLEMVAEREVLQSRLRLLEEEVRRFKGL